ncbi:phenylalanine--tRNA ligase subunit beta [Marinicellulosiphila megalodicopiae]|uniref:phenylalanine--tRNA ligase subunit beta n=1 Tax=Marinicellulosiphila megalodicopiae TaxID=2724896 RepID=UPI003BAFFA4E
MLFSEKWLRDWVNPSISAQELMDQVTMAGLEVDGSEPVAAGFNDKIVVGEILTAQPHPNADKLQVCTVSNGTDTLQVVCGAPNARAGIKVAFAQIGTVFFEDNFKIKKAKLRQVESFGMLCSEKELGLSDSHDGIMEIAQDAPLGLNIREYLDLDDISIEVDLTPNRADCLGVLGLAREVGVLNEMIVTQPEINPVAAQIDDTFAVNVTAEENCPNYVGRVIKNVDVTKASPLWLKERLRRSGLRSIDAVVDVTNYVLIELGQPMHGFDLAQLNGSINVRMADGEEKIVLLDGQEIQPRTDTLLIADDNGPLALAGIMGGQHSGVSETTKDIFLESAFFTPKLIAGKARSYGLHTDSSHRFERGVDFKLQQTAIERATQLLLDITGGQPGPLVIKASDTHMPKDKQVVLPKTAIKRLLGVELEESVTEGILTRLGLTLLESNDTQWTWDIPSWRFDISIAEDLIEELARVYGYNNLPVTVPNLALELPRKPETTLSLNSIRGQLVAKGYQEAINYSFVDEKTQSMIEPEFESVKLINPISSDLAVMRTSLWTGLAKSLQHNLNRQQDRILFFETGLRFRKDGDKILQENAIAGIAYGAKYDKNWFETGEQIDFFDVKAHLESVLDLAIGVEFTFVPGKHPALHPGQTARIEKDGKLVGLIGQLHPAIQKHLGLKQAAFVFECLIDLITESKLPQAKPLSKFPASKRDIAVLIDAATPIQDVLDSIKGQSGENLDNLSIFDLYQGEGIEPDKKSVAMRMSWQHPERSMIDDEINEIMQSIVETLISRFGAVLRG